jgi:hypothetical protein
MIKLTAILNEITVTTYPFNKILEAYIKWAKAEYDPNLSSDYEESFDYLNSIGTNFSTRNIKMLASSIKQIDDTLMDMMGERTGAYYTEYLRHTIQEICEKLNTPPKITKDLINELDKLYNYNEKI